MDKKKLFLVIAAVFVLVGIILAFTGALISTIIYDGEVSAGIGLHVTIVTLAFVAATVCLYVHFKVATGENGLTKEHLLILGCSAFSGFFFSLASGYHGRAAFLNDYYVYVYDTTKGAPVGYFSDILNSDWFVWLPEIADEYASTGTMWYLVTGVAVAITAYITYKAFHPTNN